MKSEQLQAEKQGTHGGMVIMGVFALLTCALTDGNIGFYFSIGFLTVCNLIALYVEQ